MSNPSLILPQSPAYGEDYVYAAQVEDGAVPLYNVLPLTFTRASGGTRINKDGLVQNMPYNLLENTNTFSSWNLEGGTLTSGFTAPDGSSTAYKYVQIPGGGLYSGSGGVTADVKFAQVWIKSVSGGSITVNLSDGASFFGTLNVTGEWQLFTGQYTANSRIGLYLYAISNAQGIYVWHPQVNIGSTAQPYLATTDRLNMPRITYPVGGGCGALLLEKQSTNLATYSEDATQWNAGSNVGSITVTANQTTSPDGTQNADKVVFPAVGSGSQYAVLFFPFTASATTYSGTFYLKGNVGGEIVWLSFTKDGVNYTQQLCTLTTSWQRFNLTSTLTSGADNFQIGVDTRDSSQSAKPSQTIYVWGRQLEASSYATSYIPTTSTSATRIADACYKTGISNLIGQTEGTLFLDCVVNQYNSFGEAIPLSIFQSGGNVSQAQQYIVFLSSVKAIRYVIFDGSSVQCNISTSNNFYTLGNRVKIAAAYKNNDFVLYINGVQIGTDTSGSVNAMADLYFDYQPSSNYVSQYAYNNVQLFKTRLTNAELQALTS